MATYGRATGQVATGIKVVDSITRTTIGTLTSIDKRLASTDAKQQAVNNALLAERLANTDAFQSIIKAVGMKEADIHRVSVSANLWTNGTGMVYVTFSKPLAPAHINDSAEIQSLVNSLRLLETRRKGETSEAYEARIHAQAQKVVAQKASARTELLLEEEALKAQLSATRTARTNAL